MLEYLQRSRCSGRSGESGQQRGRRGQSREALGSPVALKIVSPDIPHKTEVGGVMLDITGDDAVAAAYEQILASARRAMPEARIEGISVGPMRDAGVELFVGTMRDPQWGR